MNRNGSGEAGLIHMYVQLTETMIFSNLATAKNVFLISTCWLAVYRNNMYCSMNDIITFSTLQLKAHGSKRTVKCLNCLLALYDYPVAKTLSVLNT